MINLKFERQHQPVYEHVKHCKEFVFVAFVAALELCDQFLKFLIVDIVTHSPIIVL